jgi:hypothetical protein
VCEPLKALEGAFIYPVLLILDFSLLPSEIDTEVPMVLTRKLSIVLEEFQPGLNQGSWMSQAIITLLAQLNISSQLQI